MDADKQKTPGYQLLIVDDESYVEKMQAMFKRRGIEAIWEETGLLGVETYAQIKPDAVLLDYHLPDINGIEVFKKIKEIDPDVKVYFISAEPTPEIQDEAERLGAKGFFMKPINLLSVMNILLPNKNLNTT